MVNTALSRPEKDGLAMTVSHADVLAEAAKIDKAEIEVDVFAGPAGGHGFRKGTWVATYRGAEVKFYASVPHALELADQKSRLKQAAAFTIAARALGYK